jgi:small-conductance mechanosensitive channel
MERILTWFSADVGLLKQRGLQLVVIWLLAWVLWWLLKRIAHRIVVAADDGDDRRLSLAEKRAATVSGLIKSVGRVVVLLLAVFLTLNQVVGLNTAPLLAGISILGLAVSFGAQSLVKDFIAGTFILIENQFAVGDIIEAGGKAGVVESMTLRITCLRDLEGTLHIIPNGQIASVSNKTRGWSRSVVDVTVAYDSDIDGTMLVLRDELDRLAKDPEWSWKLDGAPEVAGVNELGDNAVAIRVLLRTVPGMQWEVGREFRRRIKKRLDQEGIEIPFPQRTVHVRHHGAGEAASDARRQAIDEAAAGGA